MEKSFLNFFLTAKNFLLCFRPVVHANNSKEQENEILR